jgi:hypothetical protein
MNRRELLLGCEFRNAFSMRYGERVFDCNQSSRMLPSGSLKCAIEIGWASHQTLHVTGTNWVDDRDESPVSRSKSSAVMLLGSAAVAWPLAARAARGGPTWSGGHGEQGVSISCMTWRSSYDQD